MSHSEKHSHYINPWTRIRAKAVYDNPWIKVLHEEVRDPSGRRGMYGLVHFRNMAVGVLPVSEDGYTWLVGQYRFPLEAWSWEIPEGGCPEGEDPVEAGRRELKEETGLEAGRWTRLIELSMSNSVTDEKAVVFLAEELTEGPSSPDSTEALEVIRIPVKEAVEWALAGKITDALSVAGLLAFERLNV